MKELRQGAEILLQNKWYKVIDNNHDHITLKPLVGGPIVKHSHYQPITKTRDKKTNKPKRSRVKNYISKQL